MTSDGLVLSCIENSLNKWLPEIINRCPKDKFRALKGQTVKVQLDGKYIYEVTKQEKMILSYKTFRIFQIMMDLIALLMMLIGVIILRRA